MERITSGSGSSGWARRLFNKPNKVGLLNRAVLWHLQLCLRLLDRLGYHATAANVSAAIDALTEEALSVDEISQMDLDREERVRLILDLFAKHEGITRPDDEDVDTYDAEKDLDR